MSTSAVPLHLADVTFPKGHPRSGETAPVNGFLLLHVDGPILFDTGLGPPQPDIDKWYRPVRYDFDAAIASAGVKRSDLVAIVNSHLHLDHCGGNQFFPGVPIFVQASEYAAAHEPNYTLPEFIDFPGASYTIVDGRREIFSGITIIPTPGHTAGHQSILIDGGAVIVAGQAAETAAHLDEPTSMEEERTASIETLLAFRPSVIYLAHD